MRRRVLAGVGAAVAFVVGVVLVTTRAQRDGRTPRDNIDADTIVLLGDSLTEQGDWAALLPMWPIANRGHSGYTTAQLLDDSQEVASHRPRSVFILTGTNDIRDGHPPSWTADQLGELVDRLQRGSPDTVLVLQTILPRSDARREVREANLAIRRLASERGLELLDLHAAFDDGTGALRADETTDGVHLAAAGYERWAAELDEMLRRLSPSLRRDGDGP